MRVAALWNRVAMDLRIFSKLCGQRIALAILLTSVFHGACQKPDAGAPPVYGDKPLYQFSDADLDAYLRDLHAREPDVRKRVVEIGRRTIGQPYKRGPLGEGGLEPYDPDPLYCLTASDCVTFVEQTWAMALSRDMTEFLDTLRRIRYRDGKIGMLTRNHFTEADWNVNNAWLLRHEHLTGRRDSGSYRLRINRLAFYAKFGLTLDEATARSVPTWRDNLDQFAVLPSSRPAGTPDAPDWAVQYFMVVFTPRAGIQSILHRLEDADVIEFVKNKKSPFVGHMGLITHDAAGTVMLLHSGEPAVQELPLMDYLARHPNIAGIEVLRVRSGLN